jgi:hypothetical protein
MRAPATNRSSIATKIALCVLIVVFVGLLAPFALMGETWGMFWMLGAAPVSFILDAYIGISHRTPLLIGFGSMVTATFWAGIAFLIVRVITRR